MEFIFFMFYILSTIVFFVVALTYSLKHAILSLICLYIFFFIIKKKRFNDNKMLFNFLLLLIFGLFAFIFDNDDIIKFKTSFVYFIFSLFFLISFFFKKFFFKTYLTKYNFYLDDIILNQINLFCALFFLFLSVLNIYIVINFSTKFWIFFKTFGFSFMFFIYLFFIYLFILKKK